MKRRNWAVVLVIMLTIFIVLTGCSGKSPDFSGNDGDIIEGDTFVNTGTDRKIIYSASLNLTGDSISGVVEKLRGLFPSDSWCDSEKISESSASFVLRVKTSEFDSFILSLNTAGKVSSLNKTAKDITSSYSNLTNNKLALEAEQARLRELMENATITEITTAINPRLTVIDAELRTINSQLNEYNSMIEYSVISIFVYTNNSKPSENFGEQIKSTFLGAWSFVVGFFSFIVKVIVALVPISVILIPIGGAIWFFVFFNSKKNKQKRLDKKAQKLNINVSNENKKEDKE